MSHSKQVSRTVYDILTETLEGFAQEYNIDLQIFGNHSLHWRLIGASAVCDFWPTTGKYWVKDPPMNGFMQRYGRSGRLPQTYNSLDRFLRKLFEAEQ